MSDFTTDTCFGCGAPIKPGVGVYYCDACTWRQAADHALEREVFDTYHEFAVAAGQHGVIEPGARS